MKINSFNSWTRVLSEISMFIFSLCPPSSYWIEPRTWGMGVRSNCLSSTPFGYTLFILGILQMKKHKDGQSSCLGYCHMLVMTGKGWKHVFLSMLRPPKRPEWMGKWQALEEERVEPVWFKKSARPLSLTWDFSHNSSFSFYVSVSMLAYVRAWNMFQWTFSFYKSLEGSYLRVFIVEVWSVLWSQCFLRP